MVFLNVSAARLSASAFSLALLTDGTALSPPPTCLAASPAVSVRRRAPPHAACTHHRRPRGDGWPSSAHGPVHETGIISTQKWRPSHRIVTTHRTPTRCASHKKAGRKPVFLFKTKTQKKNHNKNKRTKQDSASKKMAAKTPASPDSTVPSTVSRWKDCGERQVHSGATEKQQSNYYTRQKTRPQ